MARKTISQRDARKLAAEVKELRELLDRPRRCWWGDYFGGVDVGSVDLVNLPGALSAIKTARKLTHAVVAVPDGGSSVRFMALPLPAEKGRA